MAPVQPLHRGSKPLKSILKKPSQPSSSSKDRSDDFFATSKKDKRRIKHAQLLNKISTAKTKSKKRRSSKKLITTLDSLIDALPDDEELLQPHSSSGDGPDGQVNIIKRKSLKSRPGALKRKQKLDMEERARFVKNMAQLSASTASSNTNGTDAEVNSSTTASSNLGRWAALRGFISGTLEKRPAMPAANT